MKYKDYYETLGVPRAATPGRDQEGLPQARPQVPPRRQQGGRRRGALQGDQRGQRGPEGPGEARRLRPDGQQLERAGQEFQPPPDWDAGFEFRGGGDERRLRPALGGADFDPATSSSRCSAAAPRRRAGRARRGTAPAARTTTPRSLIDLEDAYRGAERSISLRAPVRDAPTAGSRCRSARSTSTSRRGIRAGPAPAPGRPGRPGRRRRAGRRPVPRDRVQPASALSRRRPRRLRRPAARAVGGGARRDRRRADARGHGAADGPAGLGRGPQAAPQGPRHCRAQHAGRPVRGARRSRCRRPTAPARARPTRRSAGAFPAFDPRAQREDET